MKKSIFVTALRPAWLPVLLAGTMFLSFTGCKESNSLYPKKETSKMPPPPPPSAKPVEKSEDSAGIYKFAEQMPQFPGGEHALMKFLHDHIHYPAAARENGIKGTVVVQFVVNPDGSLSNIKTVGVQKGGGLEEESIKVVKQMPHWIPGKQSGKKVAVQYALPIRYMLQ